MNLTAALATFRYDGSRPFRISEAPNKVCKFFDGTKDYENQLRELQKEISQAQARMYAHNCYSALLVFQAMDAAGKDGTIRETMKGVDPHGMEVTSFKEPSDEELNHSYFWRTERAMPQRGNIGIFNRSYYEEVLVCQVHPEIITKYQHLPAAATADMPKLYQQRYEQIRNLEQANSQNGTKIVKFFLNISRDEQRARFVSRIDDQTKNWKFNEGDVKERQHWDEYMRCYEQTINATATKECPWYVIPADSKKNMRLIVAAIVARELGQLPTEYPKMDPAHVEDLQKYRVMLESEPGAPKEKPAKQSKKEKKKAMKQEKSQDKSNSIELIDDELESMSQEEPPQYIRASELEAMTGIPSETNGEEPDDGDDVLSLNELAEENVVEDNTPSELEGSPVMESFVHGLDKAAREEGNVDEDPGDSTLKPLEGGGAEEEDASSTHDQK